MLKNNDSKFKKHFSFEDILIITLFLGYIAIITVNLGYTVYEVTTYLRPSTTQTTQLYWEEPKDENQKRQTFYYTTEPETAQEETAEKEIIMVYIAPHGEKYHYKSTCAGKNAITATFESASRVYEPCKKCTD